MTKIRENRRQKQCSTIKSLKLRSEIIRNGTLARTAPEIRLSFLENTVVLLVDALERRKRKVRL